MPTTLTPTVHERLARCGKRVHVSGLVANATIVLSVDGIEYQHQATGGEYTFIVPGLRPGAAVKAKQDEGNGFSPWSPAIYVEQVLVPPQSAPVLPEEITACSQCVFVSNLVPGSEVELRIGTDIVAKGIANSRGEGCFDLNLRQQRGEPGALLTARMIVCGQFGPASGRRLLAKSKLSKPIILGPLFGCQSVVPLSDLTRGARYRLEMSPQTDLGSLCACWSAVSVFVNQPLIVREKVRAQGYWDARPCEGTGDWSEWKDIEQPDERIKPKVLEALIEGDRIIRVENQIPGATLTIRIRSSSGSNQASEFGPRPATNSQEVALNRPLKRRYIVSVVQTLCDYSIESDPVTVQPPPAEVHAPVILSPLYACGRAVQVSNLHPGARVVVYEDDRPIGLQWAGLESSLSVAVAPTLYAGGKVMARQWVGNRQSPDSERVYVDLVETVRTPRILDPVAIGDTRVWLSNVMPGSHLVVRSNNIIIGEADASEPITRVNVAPISDDIQVSARFCDQLSQPSARIHPVLSPCATGKSF